MFYNTKFKMHLDRYGYMTLLHTCVQTPTCTNVYVFAHVCMHENAHVYKCTCVAHASTKCVMSHDVHPSGSGYEFGFKVVVDAKADFLPFPFSTISNPDRYELVAFGGYVNY